MLEAITAMASVIGDPYLLMLIAVTTVLGIVIGVLPGLGATTGAALLLPFTLTMSPVNAIAVLATLYVSATFAGSITAILINTPGTSAAAATTFDGFPLAQRGEAGRADAGLDDGNLLPEDASDANPHPRGISLTANMPR